MMIYQSSNHSKWVNNVQLNSTNMSLHHCIIPYFNLSYAFHQTLMNVRSLASVLTGAVRTSLVLTAACATRASSHPQTAKAAAVSYAHLTFTWPYLDSAAYAAVERLNGCRRCNDEFLIIKEVVLLPNRHWWVRGCQAVCLRPLHQYRRLLPVPVLPGIPAHTGRQPLWRHELFSKPRVLIMFIQNQHAIIYQILSLGN